MTNKLEWYFVYILISHRDGLFYIGLTKDINRRFKEHQAGKNTSTKYRRPLEVIYFEAYQNKQDAIKRERYFKQTKGKTTLRVMLKNYLKTRHQ